MRMKLVRKVRDITGKTIYRLAKEVGCNTSTVYQWEAGAKSMRLDYLSKLREVSGLSWANFGKLIDEEFGSKPKNHR